MRRPFRAEQARFHGVKARVIADRQSAAATAAKSGPCRPRSAAAVTPHLQSASSGNGPLTLIGAELQRQEESLCLMQQLKADLHTLTTALHATLDGHATPPLKPLTAAIYRTLLGLASLRPHQPAAKPDDPVYAIGTAVKHLEATHFDDPHDTAEALNRIESASDRIDALDQILTKGQQRCQVLFHGRHQLHRFRPS